MPTATYVEYSSTLPDATAQSIAEMGGSMRTNGDALRDAVVAGFMPGWNFAASGGSAEEPAALTYSKGTERIRASLTWGTTGGEDGNVTVMLLEYSSDSGSSYVDLTALSTLTVSYDSSGNVTAATWS